jgi:hypothetical protein
MATISSHQEAFDSVDQTSFKDAFIDNYNNSLYTGKGLPGYERTHSILDRVQLEMLSSIRNNQVPEDHSLYESETLEPINVDFEEKKESSEWMKKIYNVPLEVSPIQIQSSVIK